MIFLKLLNMVPPKKKEWRTETKKYYSAKNKINSHNRALKKADDTVMAKLEGERVKCPRLTKLSKELNVVL